MSMQIYCLVDQCGKYQFTMATDETKAKWTGKYIFQMFRPVAFRFDRHQFPSIIQFSKFINSYCKALACAEGAKDKQHD